MTVSKIPETVKIGAYTIRVDLCPYLLRDAGCCGRFIPCEKKIEIDLTMCEEMQWGTFYHELHEAIAEIYSIKPLAEHHGAIDMLGEVWHQILRDNGREILPK